MTHTPGPWRNPWELPEGLPDEDYDTITNDSGEIVIGVGWYDGRYLAVSRENAALICAAPDLLEALTAAENALAIAASYRDVTRAPDGDRINSALTAARRALAKARGEP